MDFQTKYNFKPQIEPGGGKRKVETAGYIPAEVQIRNMMVAGQRLGEYRAEMYDYGEEVSDDEAIGDPTRSPNFDLADAAQLARGLAEDAREKGGKERRRKRRIRNPRKRNPRRPRIWAFLAMSQAPR